MSVIEQLSSQVGDRTQEANRRVVALCLADPLLLAEIVGELGSRNAALVGDCAEVLTQVAEQRPEIVVSYAAALPPLLAHKTTRVRWEVAHALALTAAVAPAVIEPLLPRLAEIVRSDSSMIVRDYTVDSIGNYAKTGSPAAQKAYPLFIRSFGSMGGQARGSGTAGDEQCRLSHPCLWERTARHRTAVC